MSQQHNHSIHFGPGARLSRGGKGAHEDGVTGQVQALEAVLIETNHRPPTTPEPPIRSVNTPRAVQPATTSTHHL
eukprot:393129-Pyramimonas_sp.AAC.1